MAGTDFRGKATFEDFAMERGPEGQYQFQFSALETSSEPFTATFKSTVVSIVVLGDECKLQCALTKS